MTTLGRGSDAWAMATTFCYPIAGNGVFFQTKIQSFKHMVSVDFFPLLSRDIYRQESAAARCRAQQNKCALWVTCLSSVNLHYVYIIWYIMQILRTWSTKLVHLSVNWNFIQYYDNYHPSELSCACVIEKTKMADKNARSTPRGNLVSP